MWSRSKKDPARRVLRDDVVVLEIQGMHCPSCGLTIDDAVEEIPEVSRSTTSFRARKIEAVLVPGADRRDVALQVQAVVAAAGYRATQQQD